MNENSRISIKLIDPSDLPRNFARGARDKVVEGLYRISLLPGRAVFPVLDEGKYLVAASKQAGQFICVQYRCPPTYAPDVTNPLMPNKIAMLTEFKFGAVLLD